MCWMRAGRTRSHWDCSACWTGSSSGSHVAAVRKSRRPPRAARTRTPPAWRLRHRVSGARKSGCGRALLVQALGDPDLDDGLARDAESPGLPIERVDHPRGKVDVDAAAFLSRTARSGKFESRGHVLALVEPRIELLSLHRGSPPLFATAACSRPPHRDESDAILPREIGRASCREGVHSD